MDGQSVRFQLHLQPHPAACCHPQLRAAVRLRRVAMRPVPTRTEFLDATKHKQAAGQ